MSIQLTSCQKVTSLAAGACACFVAGAFSPAKVVVIAAIAGAVLIGTNIYSYLTNQNPTPLKERTVIQLGKDPDEKEAVIPHSVAADKRAAIANDTLDMIANKQVDQEAYQEMQKKTLIIHDIKDERILGHLAEIGRPKPKNWGRMIYRNPELIEILNSDSLAEARRLKVMGYEKIAVLNMANPVYPGGGFLTGAPAQEESLCRSTTLYGSLNTSPNSNSYAVYNPNLRNFLVGKGFRYNVPERGCIISPYVEVIKGSQEEDYRPLNEKERFQVTVISTAAYDLNPEHKDLYPAGIKAVDDGIYGTVTKEKIRSVLLSAIETGHDAIVLSALGCGAFRNSPVAVARLFKEVLQEPEINGRIKVTFAILADECKPGNNIEVFREELKNLTV